LFMFQSQNERQQHRGVQQQRYDGTADNAARATAASIPWSQGRTPAAITQAIGTAIPSP